MTIRTALRPAVPMAIGTAAALVALAVASRALPGHVVMIHLQETGGSAFAASRDDITLLGLVVVVLLVGGYLVAATVLGLTPARHVLVPHADYWKTPSRRRAMRRRFQTYLAVGVGATQWFVAALVVLAMVSQSGPLTLWWIPAAVSVVFVLAMLIGLIWVFTSGFTPPTSATRAAKASASVSSTSPPRPSTSGVASSVPAARDASSATRASSAVRSTEPQRATSATRSTSTPRSTTPGGKPPARPYQPRPRDGGPHRG